MAKPKEENVNIIAHIGNNKLNGIACRSKAPPSRVDKTHTPITVPANVAAEKSIWERLCVRGENHAMMNPSPPPCSQEHPSVTVQSVAKILYRAGNFHRPQSPIRILGSGYAEGTTKR
jgi:hypothetical protein